MEYSATQCLKDHIVRITADPSVSEFDRVCAFFENVSQKITEVLGEITEVFTPKFKAGAPKLKGRWLVAAEDEYLSEPHPSVFLLPSSLSNLLLPESCYSKSKKYLSEALCQVL